MEQLPILSVEGASQIEGGSGTVTFTLRLSEAPTDAVTVNYQTLSGTASAGNDVYVPGSAVEEGQITFLPGQSTQTLSFVIASDSEDELDESFFLELSDPAGARFGGANQSLQAIGWALDNDGPGLNRAIAVSNPTVVEGPGTRTAVFTISVSDAFTSSTSLTFATYDGSARAGSDYIARTGTVTLTPGQTEATVAVRLLNDALVEPGELFGLRVSGAAGVAGAAGEAAILNDDGTGPILSVEGASQIEGGSGTVTFTLRLSEAPTDAVTVNYQTLSGTASAGNDVYVPGSAVEEGQITFLPGQSTQTLSFVIASDSEDELDESFFLELSDPAGARFGGANQSLQAIGWALDNDGPGLNRAIAVSNPTMVERPGGVAVFSVEISAPSATPITLRYETVGQSAAEGRDFVARGGSITFAPGQTRAEIAVPLNSDVGMEAAESFTLNILPPFPAGISSGAGLPSGTATILDYALRGTAQGDTLNGSGSAERIEGLGGNDRLFGAGGNDHLFGGSGNDTLNGGAGTDRLVGGGGNDVYVMATRGDTVVEAARGGTDQVRAAFSVSLATQVENLTLTGSGSINGTGNNLANRIAGTSGRNTLAGRDGDDVLNGAGGSDVLNGGRGRDVLIGAAGADDFTFQVTGDSTAGARRDVIRDFVKGQDDLVLASIDANTTLSGNQAFRLDAGGTFAAGEIRQIRLGSDLLIEMNTDRDAAAEMSILLDTMSGRLGAGDFLL